MKLKKIQSGFTLIELLVVIAIIGILAAIVLTSVGTARTSAQDAKVQSTLANLRSQAEIYASANSSYYQSSAAVEANNTCTSAAANGVFTDTTIQAMITSLDTTKYCTHNGTATTKATKYAVAVILPSLSTTAWCIDSTGVSKKKTGLTADTPSGAVTSTACN